MTWVTTDLYDAILPILHFNRIIGLFPIAIRTNGPLHFFKFSVRRIIAGYVLMIMLSIYGLYRTYQIEVYYQIRLGRTSAKVATLSEVGILLITWAVGTISLPLRTKYLRRYLESVKKVDSLLGKFKPSKPKKYDIIVISTFAICLYIIIMDLSLYNKTIGKYATVLVLFKDFSPFYFSYIFTMLLQSNFYIFVKIIAKRVKRMNELILSYGRCYNEEDFRDNSMENKLFSKNKGNSKAPVGQIYLNCVSVITCRPEMDKLAASALRQVYSNMLQASEALNDLMGFMIMLVLFGILLHMVVTPYCLYQQLQYTKSGIFLFGQTCWMLGHILRFLLLVEPCQACTEEFKKSSDLICQLVSTTADDQVAKQLKLLLIHMTRCPLEFTAWGLAKINRELIPPITGVVATFLVVLFQYPN